MEDALIDNIIENVETTIENKAITPVNLLVVCLSVMQLAEKAKNGTLKGGDKKQLALTVMEKLIAKYGNGDQSLLPLLPGFIDTSIKLDRDEVVIHVKPEEVAGCCLGLFAPKK